MLERATTIQHVAQHGVAPDAFYAAKIRDGKRLICVAGAKHTWWGAGGLGR
jgi:hypothetical protein